VTLRARTGRIDCQQADLRVTGQAALVLAPAHTQLSLNVYAPPTSGTTFRFCRIQRAKSRHDVAASRVGACVSTHLAQRPTAASGLPVAPGPEVDLGLRRSAASR
jgi:hypothetical protein